MKAILTVALALCATVQLSSADLIADLVGKWKSVAPAPASSVTIVYKRLGEKSFVNTVKITGPKKFRGTMTTTYSGDGAVSGRYKNTFRSGTFTGTWQISGNQLSEELVVKNDLERVSNVSESFTLVNPRKIIVRRKEDGSSSFELVLKKVR